MNTPPTSWRHSVETPAGMPPTGRPGDRRAVRDRDAAVARTDRLRRALVTGSVAGSVGIAGALAVAAITSQPSAANSAGAGSGTAPATPHSAAHHPHLTPGQRLLRQLQNLTNGGPSGTGQSGGSQSSGGGLASGSGPGHATTSGS